MVRPPPTTIERVDFEASFPLVDWYDFEQLVQDEAIKAELRPHFEADLEV